MAGGYRDPKELIAWEMIGENGLYPCDFAKEMSDRMREERTHQITDQDRWQDVEQAEPLGFTDAVRQHGGPRGDQLRPGEKAAFAAFMGAITILGKAIETKDRLFPDDEKQS